MGVARFSFHDLCGIPLGAVDYLRIAREFHTVIIDHVPVMDYAMRNEAKRFIALIDTLYDRGVKLVASADAEPADIYQADEGFEASEFKRTVSRIAEMGSAESLGLPLLAYAVAARLGGQGIGMTAATSEPSRTRSTMPAKSRPTASPTPNSCGTPCAMSVEKATSTPSMGSDSKCSMTPCFDAS